MKPLAFSLLLAFATLSLGGCAAGLAAGAVGAVARAADKSEAPPSEDTGPAARQACTAEAARYGTVRIIDTEYRSASRLIVWGTVENSTQQRRSFECQYERKIVGFKLRAI
ncbi:MAG TPA: hypothetical protein VGB70_06670 [Allosphingosinicella sp.]|jgi:hypothetical protein